ncbi:MAG TPA: hypothetical protein VN453_08990, partial [Feifaniaceae bacterium]|nr:hypothetical protein [Feifaniaceae bacterium]
YTCRGVLSALAAFFPLDYLRRHNLGLSIHRTSFFYCVRQTKHILMEQSKYGEAQEWAFGLQSSARAAPTAPN